MKRVTIKSLRIICFMVVSNRAKLSLLFFIFIFYGSVFSVILECQAAVFLVAEEDMRNLDSQSNSMAASEEENLEEKLRSLLAQLRTESGILERMVYKNKNQHRRCVYFQYLLKVLLFSFICFELFFLLSRVCV